MFAGLLLVVPLVLLLVAGTVAAVVVLARRVPAARLDPAVAAARRHAALVAVVALAVTAAVLLAGTSLRPTWLGGTQVVATVPLVAATAHALVSAAGAALHRPRRASAVRTARLVPRTVREHAPRVLARATTAAAAGLLLVCALGTALADGTGRSVSWTSPDGVLASSAGAFPGAFYAGPVAAAAVVLASVTALVVRGLVRRPAVPGADATTDALLRTAAVHRVLRVTLSALLGTAGALLVVGGEAAARVTGGRYAVDGVWTVVAGDPLWQAGGVVAAVAGLLAALAGVLVLALPAPGLRPAPGEPAPGEPVPA
ncbi:hypothetical protein [Kineococcus terrestris]|uniref:hypothetical protein n=1 Tax=Kineococcus terrestris TaxID=2044856 RepID=UPI0034DB6D44